MTTHHQGSAVRPKISFNSSHPVPAVLKSGPKMTKNGCSLSMLLLYTIGKPMERKYKIKKNKKIDVSHLFYAPPKNCSQALK